MTRARRIATGLALALPAAVAAGLAWPLTSAALRAGAAPFAHPWIAAGALDDWLGIASERSVAASVVQAEGAAELLRLTAALGLLTAVAAVLALALSVLVRTAALRPETALRAALGAVPRRITSDRLRRALPAIGLSLAAAAVLALWTSGHLLPDWHPAARVATPGLLLSGLAGGLLLLVAALGLWLGTGRVDRRDDLVREIATSGGPAPVEGRIRTAATVLQAAAVSIVLFAAAAVAGPLAVDPATAALRGLDPVDTVVARVHLASPAEAGDLEAALGEAGARAALSTPGAWAGFGRIEGVRVFCDGCVRMNFAAPIIDGSARIHAVSRGYFEVHGVEVVRGRNFDADDERTVVVSEAFARQLVTGADPVGQEIQLRRETTLGMFEERYVIVGVVRDVLALAPGNERIPEPALYLPLEHHPATILGVAVRSEEGTVAATAALEEGLLASRASIAAGPVTLVDHLIDLALPTRWFGRTVLVLAAGAVVLGVIALFGLTRDAVARRTREIGIRRALGARGSDVRLLVFGWAAAVLGGGTALGTFVSIPLVRRLQLDVVGVDPFHPGVMLGIAGLLLLTVAAAALGPSRRAVRIDPAEAIRSD